MKTMRFAILILTLLLSVAVTSQEDDPINVPQIAVKVPLNETVQLDKIAISFVEVITDSRCPKNVECIWAGEAKVRVLINTEDGKKAEDVITFKNELAVITSLFNTELHFLQLTPYPDANISETDKAPYALLVQTRIK